jgi:hypothetical protein
MQSLELPEADYSISGEIGSVEWCFISIHIHSFSIHPVVLLEYTRKTNFKSAKETELPIEDESLSLQKRIHCHRRIAMNYGILVVECDELYQIIGAVDSKDEAFELAREYERTADPDRDCPPGQFVINRRDHVGRYTVREMLEVG